MHNAWGDHVRPYSPSGLRQWSMNQESLDFRHGECQNKDAGRDTLYTHDIELTFKRYVISSIMRSSRLKSHHLVTFFFNQRFLLDSSIFSTKKRCLQQLLSMKFLLPFFYNQLSQILRQLIMKKSKPQKRGFSLNQELHKLYLK